MDRPDIRRLPKRMNPLEAQKQLLDAVKETAPKLEAIALADASGRVLAKDVFSDVDVPEYDKTFIDGYAINPQNTEGASVNAPASFRVIFKLFPSDYPATVQVGEGEAVYVACGAPIPKGAAATVKVEETRLHGDQIEVVREIKAGEGIIPRGDDVRKGDLILAEGRILRPQDIGLLASVGQTKAEVFKKPVVAVLSGGDELIGQRQKNPEKIANNYALVVAGLASELGASAKLLGIMPDSLERVQDTNRRGVGGGGCGLDHRRLLCRREGFRARRREHAWATRRRGAGGFAASWRGFRLRRRRRQTRRYAAWAHRLMHRRLLPLRCTLNQRS